MTYRLGALSYHGYPDDVGLQELSYQAYFLEPEFVCRCLSLLNHLAGITTRLVREILVFAHKLFYPKSAVEEVPTSDEDFRDKGKEGLLTLEALELREWPFPYTDYTLFGYLPDDLKEATTIKRKASQFYYNATLRLFCRCTPDELLLRCLSNQESQEILKEACNGICGAHQFGPKLGDQIYGMGYYWPKLFSDATYAKQCHACQIYWDHIHQASGHLHATKVSWPFEV